MAVQVFASVWQRTSHITKTICLAIIGADDHKAEPLLNCKSPNNNTLHTEPRAASFFLLACLSPRPGERCRYRAQRGLPRCWCARCFFPVCVSACCRMQSFTARMDDEFVVVVHSTGKLNHRPSFATRMVAGQIKSPLSSGERQGVHGGRNTC